jgi:hypothetical protein
VIDTFQIQSVDDFSGSLDNLGRPEAALAEKRAKSAEAQPLQEAEQAKAIADEQVAAPMSAIKNMTAVLPGMAGTLTRSSSWRCRPVATGHPPPCHRQSGRQAALVIAGIRE